MALNVSLAVLSPKVSAVEENSVCFKSVTYRKKTGARGSLVVKTLGYKLESRGFENR
jgi:hypothetical protein